jgi:arylsulfatase
MAIRGRASTNGYPSPAGSRTFAFVRSAAVAACAVALAACTDSAPVARARRVVLITCDTLRADRLGAYGYPLPTSPEVDRFARESIVFEEAYTTAPWTGPALSSLLTGRMPEEVGVGRGNRFYMPADVRTLAEAVFDGGIPTGAVVSNWVLRRPSPSRGDVGVAQGFVHFDDEMKSAEPNREAFERDAEGTTDAAIRWLDKQKQANTDRFFLWVHYQDPHGPYAPPAENARAFERPLTSEAEVPTGETNSGKDQIPKYQAIAGQQQPESYRIRYDGEVRTFDQGFGRLIEWLRKSDWFDDALIVFTADHGESLGEHGYWFCHGENLNREVVRVPFVVHFPKGATHPIARPAGGYQRFAPIVGHLDLWPTVIDAFGLTPTPSRGVSLFNERLPPGRIMPQSYGALDGPTYWRGISDGRYHLIAADKEPVRLYDIVVDPGEMNDIVGAQPVVARQLTEKYRAFLEANAVMPQQGIEMDAAAQKGLHGLGYTGGE